MRYGLCCLGCLSRMTAARRMKGVVRPQHAPTAKKLRTHRQIGGEAGATATGPSGSIGDVDVVVYQANRGMYNILGTRINLLVDRGGSGGLCHA